jgi:hypothetical protein
MRPSLVDVRQDLPCKRSALHQPAYRWLGTCALRALCCGPTEPMSFFETMREFSGDVRGLAKQV